MSGRERDVDVSVLIATRDRADSLAATLESLEQCDFSRERYHAVVADNGGDPATREVCGEFATALPLEYVAAPVGGKNAALNRALEAARGELFVFTDDDVVVDEGWLSAMWEGAERWRDHDVFGGRVLPLWPDGPPKVVLETRYAGVAYSILDPEHGEGTDPDFLPFGPNFAVRRRVFDEGMRFDPALGPRPGAYTMGGETELLERLRDRGYLPIFLPDSVVHHRIRPSQYAFRWLLGRARKFGRSMADRHVRTRAEEGEPALDRIPSWLYRGVLEFGARALGAAVVGRRAAALEHAMEAAIEVGKIDYLKRLTDEGRRADMSSSPHAVVDRRPTGTNGEGSVVGEVSE